MRIIASIVLLLAWLAGGARAQEEGAAAQPGPPINTMCPVMPEEPVDPEYTIVWEGRSIGLCCSTCRRKFLRDPQTYLALLPEPEAAPSADPVTAGAAGAEDGGASRTLDAIALVGRLHPLSVHFPIALLCAAALAELLHLVCGRSGARQAMRFCLGLGTLGALCAVLLGLAAARGESFPGELAAAFERHRVLGIATAVLAIACWLLAARATAEGAGPRLLLAWRALLTLTVLALVLAGHFGGILVFGPDHIPF